MGFLKWLYPGMKFKRWLLLFAFGVLALCTGITILFNYKYIGNLEEAIFRTVYLWTGSYDYMVNMAFGTATAGAGLILMLVAIRQTIRSIIGVLLPDGSEKLVDLIFAERKLSRGPAVAVIGGGTGLSVLLRGIKTVTKNVTAIVTVADDGGSSGRLREDLGILPPGDLRNCLVALAETEPLMEKLFQHRFGGRGDLAGHSFGNLFIAAMTETVGGNMEEALKASKKILAVRGQVLPATISEVKLMARLADGRIIEGESRIPLSGTPIDRVYLEPADAKPVQSALSAIDEAQVIFLGPGSLYTSVMPNLLIDGMADALRKSKATKVYICNVMTQPGETDGYSVSAHVKAIFDHVGEGIIDYVIVNGSRISDEVCEVYAREGAEPVIVDKDKTERLGVKVIEADLISRTNLARHDPQKLSQTIISMLYDYQIHRDQPGEWEQLMNQNEGK